MNNAKLTNYVKKCFEVGMPIEQISSLLLNNGWSKEDIEKIILEVSEQRSNELISLSKVLVPRKSDKSFSFSGMSVVQILFVLGSLAIITSIVIFIAVSWHKWNSFSRISAVFLPMILLFLFGIYLNLKLDYKKYSIIFLLTSAIIFPAFLFVIFFEFIEFLPSSSELVCFSIASVSLGLYLLLGYIFRHPIWLLLSGLAGLMFHYLYLDFIGVNDVYGSTISGFYFLIPSTLYLVLGYYFEGLQKRQESKYLYFLGFTVMIFVMFKMIVTNDIFKPFINDYDYSIRKYLFGWSGVTISFVYLAIAMFINKLKKLNYIEIGRYYGLIAFLNIFTFLVSILYLSFIGKNLFYETLLLVSSLVFVYLSTLKQLKRLLYVGTISLIIYIFQIGEKYFQDKIGWSVTLMLVGVISIAIGLLVEKIRRGFISGNAIRK